METEEKAWKNLMLAINEMGAIPNYESNFYKKYHQKWNVLIDRARIYSRVANLKEKYGLDEEKEQ